MKKFSNVNPQMLSLAEIREESYKQGTTDEYNRIIGFLKWNKYCVVDNKGDYYSIEELEEQLKEQNT